MKIGIIAAMSCEIELLKEALKDPVIERIVRGLVASGDQFVSSRAQRGTILSAFPDALCAEMEGGAIGHVCMQNGVPFCIVRCMSDSANGDSSVDFAAFSAEAGRKSAGYLLKLLRS